MGLYKFTKKHPLMGLNNSFRLSRAALLLFNFLLLAGCQTSIVERVSETAGKLATGVKNIPSTIIPSGFVSTARIDSDFSIRDASVETDGEYTVVRAFFATNRSTTEEAIATKMFREGRADDVSFGKSYITLKRYTDTFDIERESLIKIDIVDEPIKPAALAHNELFSREKFASELDGNINRSDNNSLLLYVHGFNTSFEEAAIKSAQLSYDIGFSGTTAFFSWPARSDFPTYIADSESAQASQRYFESMINDLMFMTSASKVYIVAQSMGARLTAKAMKAVFLTHPEFRNRIKELILLTPDIDAEEFTEDLAPYLGTLNSPVTLYASSNESSLAVSKTFNSSPLAGDSSESILVTARAETIDTGAADVSLAAHSAYSDTSSVLADIWNLIENGIRANSRRPLRANYSSEAPYWEYAK